MGCWQSAASILAVSIRALITAKNLQCFLTYLITVRTVPVPRYLGTELSGWNQCCVSGSGRILGHDASLSPLYRSLLKNQKMGKAF